MPANAVASVPVVVKQHTVEGALGEAFRLSLQRKQQRCPRQRLVPDAGIDIRLSLISVPRRQPRLQHFLSAEAHNVLAPPDLRLQLFENPRALPGREKVRLDHDVGAVLERVDQPCSSATLTITWTVQCARCHSETIPRVYSCKATQRTTNVGRPAASRLAGLPLSNDGIILP